MVTRRRAYLAWFFSTLYVIYSFSLNTAAAVFAGSIKQSLNLSAVELSYAVSAFVIAFAAMQIPAGFLLDKYATRTVMCFGIAMLVVGNVLAAFAHHLTDLIIANVIQGIGGSFAFVGTGIVIAQWFPAALFPIMFGFTQTGACVLSGVTHHFFRIALEDETWNEVYIKLAICGAVIFLFNLLALNNSSQQKSKPSIKFWAALKSMGGNRLVQLCALAAACSFGVLLSYASFWYLNVGTYHQINTEEAVKISGIIFVGIGVGTPFWAWISNHYYSRINVVHITLCLGVMSLLLGLYLPHVMITNLWVARPLSFAIGLFLSGSMLLYTVVEERIVPELKGMALSIINTEVFLCNSLLMFLPYVFSTSLAYYTSLWTLPFLVMIAILIVPFILPVSNPSPK